MKKHDRLLNEFMKVAKEKLGERVNGYLFPPPIFLAMKGEFVDVDLQSHSLTTRFPILDTYRNPYGTMQGGMIVAAVDNTIGPLSITVAPLNVTRTLEMKYSHPVKPEMGDIVCKGKAYRA